MGFPGGSAVKNSPADAGDTGDVGSIPGLGRSPGGEYGNTLQSSGTECWKISSPSDIFGSFAAILTVPWVVQ